MKKKLIIGILISGFLSNVTTSYPIWGLNWTNYDAVSWTVPSVIYTPFISATEIAANSLSSIGQYFQNSRAGWFTAGAALLGIGALWYKSKRDKEVQDLEKQLLNKENYWKSKIEQAQIIYLSDRKDVLQKCEATLERCIDYYDEKKKINNQLLLQEQPINLNAIKK
ncbi:MAG: hypothetical protein WDZ41_00280 [Candidatus Babeliales bacterium]